MEEVMYWCPCQLAMKNNMQTYETGDVISHCNVIDFGFSLDDPVDNYYIDKTIHNFCESYCEYYKALLEMSEGVRIN